MVYVSHLHTLTAPIVDRVLEYAQAIDPQVLRLRAAAL